LWSLTRVSFGEPDFPNLPFNRLVFYSKKELEKMC